jgi:hypothetical protein
MNITHSDAIDLLERIEAGAKDKNLLGVIMPNGKPLGECTGAYVAQLGRQLEELGSRLARAGVQ